MKDGRFHKWASEKLTRSRTTQRPIRDRFGRPVWTGFDQESFNYSEGRGDHWHAFILPEGNKPPMSYHHEGAGKSEVEALADLRGQHPVLWGDLTTR